MSCDHFSSIARFRTIFISGRAFFSKALHYKIGFTYFSYSVKENFLNTSKWTQIATYDFRRFFLSLSSGSTSVSLGLFRLLGYFIVPCVTVLRETTKKRKKFKAFTTAVNFLHLKESFAQLFFINHFNPKKLVFILSKLISLHFFRCWEGEFVFQSGAS